MNNSNTYFPGRHSGGITARDQIAIEAMKVILSSPHCPRTVDNDALADQCFSLADSMIARSKK